MFNSKSQYKSLIESWKFIQEMHKVLPYKKIKDGTYDFSTKGIDYTLFSDEYIVSPSEVTFEYYFAVKDPNIEGGYDYNVILNKVDPTDILSTIIEIFNNELSQLPEDIKNVNIAFSPTKKEDEKKLKPQETKRGRFYLKYFNKYLTKKLEKDWKFKGIKYYTNQFEFQFARN